MQSEGRNDHIDYYGPWGWLSGFILGTSLILIMFVVADGFS
ncbi:MAG: hypothetical protein O3A39_01255 [Proteobacteria bacterium]|nr:hypothetical protein [Pseudomonadota bacterium]